MMLSALAVAAVAVAQQPKPCTFPREFTSVRKELRIGSDVVDLGYTAYDAINERVFEKDYAFGQDQKIRYERILLYKENRAYYINLETKACTYNTIPPNRRFHDFQVYANSSYVGAARLGLYDAKEGGYVDLHEFSYKSAMQANGAFILRTSVTEFECMPVNIFLTHINPDGSLNLTESYMLEFQNSVLGIEDPSVFVPPAGCVPGPRPSPPPSPPSPPSPPPPIKPQCLAAMVKDCGTARKSANECFSCIKKFEKELAAAKCTVTEEREFCDPRM